MPSATPFPHDLPDLLRLACGSGKLRLNVFHGASAEHGPRYQANLANSGNGWTVDYRRDPLEAIAVVLRTRYGAMLERERAKLAAGERDCGLHHHLPDGGAPYCDCGGIDGDGIEDGIAFVLSRRGVADADIWPIVEEVLDRIYGSDPQNSLHKVEMITAGAALPAPAAAIDDEFSALADDFEALL